MQYAGASLPRRIVDPKCRLVASVAVLRIIVRRVALPVPLVVTIAVIGLRAVDIDVPHEAAVVDPTLPRQVDLALAVVTVAGVAPAVGDAAHQQLAVAARLDAADAEDPPPSITVTIVATVGAAEALLHGSGAPIDTNLAVGAVSAVAVAEHVVQHLADDVTAVGTAVTGARIAVTGARIILRRRGRRTGQRRNRDAARHKLRDCRHDPDSSRSQGRRSKRTPTHCGPIARKLHGP